MGSLSTPNTGEGTTNATPASGAAGATREGIEDHQVHDLEESDSEPETEKEEPDKTSAESSITAYLEQMFSKRFDAMQSMVERLPGVAPPIRRSNPDSYTDTPFARGDCLSRDASEILLPQHQDESREATTCKWFGSTLIGPTLQWYINLPTRSISSFAGLSDKFVEQFASSRSLEKTSDGLYEILQHRVEPLRDYIAHFNQEKVAVPECSIPTAICLQERPTSRWRALQRANHPSQGSTQTGSEVHPIRPGRPRRKILPKGIQGLRKQEPGQVNWPPKMRAPDSFRDPGLWCDFHHDHGHKTKAHHSKEASGKSKGDTPSSPPRQDRVIHVISGGSEVSGVSHAAAKKSTRNTKHGKETAQPKRLLLGTDEISFTAKEQEKILAPHHDALVVSHTIANCLVKRILVDNRSSSNIIFLTAYQDLGLEENALTCKVTPLIGFSGEDPHPPPHIDKIARSFKSYQPAISQINEWGTDTSTKPPRKRAPSRHQTEIGDLRTHLPQWMNETTCFMEALKTSIDRRQWPPNVNVGVKNGHDGINTQKSSEIVFPRR
ncbi:hypothetical protein DY000_02042886 [Brassica cretica]|uniref:Retrotransposon gag domain-containing protein n=1 Tax=Brassica cretica TaxID=69181 RepID=A0ABQ7BL00_BRACR|nr:hypothetical protein DY000_02042886 [Brassica cretica]